MNNMQNLVARADAFAAQAHGSIDQRRKYGGEPYIVHPREVRELLLKFAHGAVSAEQEAASLLHDVVEDTPVTLEQVQAEFGADVAVLVEALTDVSRPEHGNRRARKALDLAHTAAAPLAAKTVKLADLISNARSIVAHDPGFARVWLREKAAILEACADADPGLLAEAQRVLGVSLAALAHTRGK
jgi:(p)ppGpp synthase/HD superfamily hydrolase